MFAVFSSLGPYDISFHLFTYVLQERVPHHCSSYFWSWLSECLVTKLSFIDYSSLFGWSWFGRWACSLLLVSRVYSCPKQRHLDGCFPRIMDCWDSFWSLTCMGMPMMSLLSFISLASSFCCSFPFIVCFWKLHVKLLFCKIWSIMESRWLFVLLD